MKSVFIVDDDQNVINGLKEHIPWRQLSLNVQGSALNGGEALKKIRERKPDIVITDVYMPALNGLELIQKIRKEFPDIHVIIYSAYEDFENARQAMKYGVQHFLLKPAAVSEFESVLDTVVNEIKVEEKQNKLLQYDHEQIDKYIGHVRDSFFRDMLNKKRHELHISKEKLELLGIPLNSKVIVASISMIRSPYLKKSDEREWQLLKFGASNIILETIEQTSMAEMFHTHLVDYSDSTFVLIFLSNRSDRMDETVMKVSEHMITNILSILKLSLAIGVGGVKDDIREIKNSFVESQRALEMADYEEINRVYSYREVKRDSRESFQYPLEILKEIYGIMNRKECENIMDGWAKLEDYLLKNKAPTFIVQNICVSLVSSLLIQEYYEEKIDDDGQMISAYISDIYNMHSKRQLFDWMRHLLIKWSEKLKEQLTGKRSHFLIREVKEYVQRHYDREIKLAEIAELLHVNKNYLSQLFKKVTGDTFVSYLNKYRIEKAKTKLREGRYLIYEISEMVGYQNPTYFSQVFKSITGMSPSEYVSRIG